MADPAAAALVPVLFFDGDREVDLGPIAVHPTLGFKKLQSLIGERIGVAPHQISTSLVRRHKPRPPSDARRRVPLDEASDLAAIIRERDCFLLAVLRRSRRERRGRFRRRKEVPSPPPPPLPREVTILRRGASVAATGRGSDGLAPQWAVADARPPPECGQCAAGGGAAAFHWCVRDAVTVGFRSAAGPIQRPAERRVEASS